jgi:hypothetical protein
MRTFQYCIRLLRASLFPVLSVQYVIGSTRVLNVEDVSTLPTTSEHLLEE